MEIEIDRVLQSDDAAWEMVEAAKAMAEKIRMGARQEALEIVRGKEEELASALAADQKIIFSDAQIKAGNILREANHYIERMREKEAAIHPRLIDQLLSKVAAA
jgi:sialic acid synthase SpsE